MLDGGEGDVNEHNQYTGPLACYPVCLGGDIKRTLQQWVLHLHFARSPSLSTVLSTRCANG